VRTPVGRSPASPALAFLREVAFRPVDPAHVDRWAPRLAAGGLVRELERDRWLRRALPHLGSWIERAGLLGSIPPAERTLLHAASLASAASASRLRATLGPLGAACKAQGVAPLLLKGAALHGTLHATPAERAVSDADVCIAPSDRAALVRALVTAGFEPDGLTAARLVDLERTAGRASALSDLIFRRHDGLGVPVEVKLDPVQVGVPLRRPTAFFDGAMPSPVYEGFLVPAPEPMAVQQALHLARHDGSDALWFAELAHGVARASATGRFDVARARRILAGEGLDAVVRRVFEAARALFPGTIPPALVRGRGGPVPPILRARPRSRARVDERRATLSLAAHHALASGRWLVAARSFWARLRPSDGYVAARMSLPTGVRVRPIDRARRLVRLLRLARAT